MPVAISKIKTLLKALTLLNAYLDLIERKSKSIYLM
jgi:hypothetical protein